MSRIELPKLPETFKKLTYERACTYSLSNGTNIDLKRIPCNTDNDGYGYYLYDSKGWESIIFLPDSSIVSISISHAQLLKAT